jgi:uncharacterized protein (UPF0548 family)
MRLRRPSAGEIARHLGAQRTLAYTYAGVGGSRDGRVPRWFSIDHNRCRLGAGESTFVAAKAAMREWRMFPTWTRVEPHAPIAPDEVIAITLRVGLWWVNAARIVYVIDEPRRFGFAYGTLPGHAESGEERFTVEWLDDDSVWYDVRAFSRPRHWAAWLGYPVTRALQQRFARHSLAAMTAAVARQ